MSEEGRRVFKIETVLALIAGKAGSEVTDLLCYLTQRDLSAQEEGAVAPMAKGWIYSQNPAFMEAKFDETDVYADWVAKQAKRLDDNVSLTPIPAGELEGINAVLDSLNAAKETVAEQASTIEELEAKVSELEPYPGKVEELEKKVEELSGKIEELESENKELKSATAEFEGKVPVAEDELNNTIKDIVTKALKDAVASVPAGAAGEAGEAAPAAAEEEQTGGVPDDFGFGSSGSDDSGFGF
jgi:uncharacterized coiled-coil protein SlyX